MIVVVWNTKVQSTEGLVWGGTVGGCEVEKGRHRWNSTISKLLFFSCASLSSSTLNWWSVFNFMQKTKRRENTHQTSWTWSSFLSLNLNKLGDGPLCGACMVLAELSLILRSLKFQITQMKSNFCDFCETERSEFRQSVSYSNFGCSSCCISKRQKYTKKGDLELLFITTNWQRLMMSICKSIFFGEHRKLWGFAVVHQRNS